MLSPGVAFSKWPPLVDEVASNSRKREKRENVKITDRFDEARTRTVLDTVSHAVRIGVVASHHFDSQPRIPGKQLACSPRY